MLAHTCKHQRKEYYDQVRERDHYTCQICGGPGNEVDHIEPVAISHNSELSNLRVLCRQCNLATRRKRKDALPTWEEWDKWAVSELARLRGLNPPLINSPA